MNKTCNNCASTNKENKTPSSVPYQVFLDFKETSTATIKRLWILIVVLVLMVVGTNAAWLIYESQFETFYYEQDGNGINNVNIGEQGDLINGAESEIQEEEENIE